MLTNTGIGQIQIIFQLFNLFLDWLEDVEYLANVSILGLQEGGEPAAIVSEAHVHHGLERHLDPGVGVGGRGWWRRWGLGQVGVQRLRGGVLSSLLIRHHGPVLFIIRRGVGLLG